MRHAKIGANARTTSTEAGSAHCRSSNTTSIGSSRAAAPSTSTTAAATTSRSEVGRSKPDETPGITRDSESNSRRQGHNDGIPAVEQYPCPIRSPAFAACVINQSTSVDLPIPGSPSTNTARPRPRTTSCRAANNSARSRWRPIISTGTTPGGCTSITKPQPPTPTPTPSPTRARPPSGYQPGRRRAGRCTDERVRHYPGTDFGSSTLLPLVVLLRNRPDGLEIVELVGCVDQL